MKKLLLLIAATLFVAAAYSQGQPKFVYCELVGTSNLTGTKVTVELDFGQKTSLTSDERLRGDDGKPMKFSSMVDAMNWMGSDGWEFAQAYIIGDGPYIYHWLLKKNIENLSPEQQEEVSARFKTKKDFRK